MRGRVGSVTEISISVFSTGISVSGLEILPFALHPGYQEENNTMHFRDRTDITELFILFSSIMKLGVVLFDS